MWVARVAPEGDLLDEDLRAPNDAVVLINLSLNRGQP
jgi:hypothetical protein